MTKAYARPNTTEEGWRYWAPVFIICVFLVLWAILVHIHDERTDKIQQRIETPTPSPSTSLIPPLVICHDICLGV